MAGMNLILDELRVSLGEVEITRYLRTGRERLAVDGNRVVFADSRHPWTVHVFSDNADELAGWTCGTHT
jgi:hypothetical protein